LNSRCTRVEERGELLQSGQRLLAHGLLEGLAEWVEDHQLQGAAEALRLHRGLEHAFAVLVVSVYGGQEAKGGVGGKITRGRKLASALSFGPHGSRRLHARIG